MQINFFRVERQKARVRDKYIVFILYLQMILWKSRMIV